MAGKHFKLLDRAFLGNDGVQADRPCHARLPRERRIDRLYTVDQRSGRNRTALANTSLRRARWRRPAAGTTNYAAENASHAATSDAARNATGHAHSVGSFSLFL